MRILAIVNPVAGKTCKYWPAIKSVFHDMEYDFEVQYTEERGHATAIAAQNNGFDVIASVGGDGTLNEIVNGIMGRDIVLSVIPTGTGNDFVKSAGLLTDCITASRSISQDVIRRVDAGCVTFSGGKRYFIGVAGMGFDGLVSKTTSQVSKPKMGTVPYVMGILKHLADYKSVDISLTVDDLRIDQKVMFVDVANGKYVGAGMNIAPHAEVDDGLFDVIVIGDLSRLESLMKLPTLYRGTHLNNPKVGAFRGRHVELESTQPLSIHVEGEYIGDTPATFDMYEKALKFCAPPI
ncbi:MAG: diacylglycerol kinase family protein [Candidatus Methanofastidiosia archaeon]